MNFKEIKEKCVPGKTVLLSGDGYERLFIELNEDYTQWQLLTRHTPSGDPVGWGERDIENWTIKQEPKKLYAYTLGEGVHVFLGTNDILSGYTRAPEYDIEYK